MVEKIEHGFEAHHLEQEVRPQSGNVKLKVAQIVVLLQRKAEK